MPYVDAQSRGRYARKMRSSSFAKYRSVAYLYQFGPVANSLHGPFFKNRHVILSVFLINHLTSILFVNVSNATVCVKFLIRTMPA